MSHGTTLPERTDVVSDAFHGTSLAKAKEIIVKNFVLPDDRPENRYGRAVYFWRNSPATATWWANKRHPAEKIAVVRANVGLGKYLDVSTREGEEILTLWARKLRERNYDGEVTEAAILNFLAHKGMIETAQVVHIPDDLENLIARSYSVVGVRTILCVYRVDKILERAIVADLAA